MSYLQAVKARALCAESIARDVARGFKPHESEVQQFRELDATCDSMLEKEAAEL